MTEQELLIDCLARLNRAGISYFLTGSMASNYWGIPRTTHDLDFVIQLPSSAITTMIASFCPDYYLDEAAIRSAYVAPYQFNAIDTRSALKVDFWLSQPNPFEREMFRRRQHVTLLGQEAWITTAEDCVLHKLLWNKITPSARQLADAAGIVSVQASKLDSSYLLEWAVTLGVTEELNQLLSGAIKPKQT